MKSINIKILMLIIGSLTMIRCEFENTDFGFDGEISGTVIDKDGNPLHGDLSSNTLLVTLLGEGDQQPIEIRVNGEGTYQNLKMFPKKHKVWLRGPIVSSDTITVDFSVQQSYQQNFSVVPLTTPKLASATGRGSSINVNYSIVSNTGSAVAKKQIYCSTVPYPTAATGSRTNVYFTKTVTLPSNSGDIVIDGLDIGVKYYVRIGSQASGSALMNYSNQIVVSL